jgi:cell division protein FtsW
MGSLTIAEGRPILEAEGTARATWDWHRPSFRITLIALALTCFGLVMVASAGGSRDFAGSVLKRLVLTGIGLCAFLVGARVDYRVWRRHQLALLALALGGLVLVMLPGLSEAKNGARRWLEVGLPLGIQPSEFAKVGLCIWVAAYADRHLARMRRPVEGFLVPMAVVGAGCLLVLVEPDFGTAVLMGAVCTLTLWVMGTRLLFIVAAMAAAMPLVERLVLHVPYRAVRVMSFLNPWADPRGTGYQLIQSKIAIGSGGIFGLGLGTGRQEEGFLPAANNDFIFSVVAEELGFIGAVLLVLVFVWLLYEGIRVTLRSRDPFAFALALGLTALLGMQAAAHIAVVTGSVPTKGLALPFVSAGGSSLIASLLAAGILVNIALREERPPEGEPSAGQEDAPRYETVAMGLMKGAGGALARTIESWHRRNNG